MFFGLLVPWYLYWLRGITCHGIHMVSWYFYLCHGIDIGTIILILVKWHLSLHHCIWIGVKSKIFKKKNIYILGHCSFPRLFDVETLRTKPKIFVKVIQHFWYEHHTGLIFFYRIGPLGRFGLVVAMSVCLSVCVCVWCPLPMRFF